jgi:hypothetical protein
MSSKYTFNHAVKAFFITCAVLMTTLPMFGQQKSLLNAVSYSLTEGESVKESLENTNDRSNVGSLSDFVVTVKNNELANPDRAGDNQQYRTRLVSEKAIPSPVYLPEVTAQNSVAVSTKAAQSEKSSVIIGESAHSENTIQSHKIVDKGFYIDGDLDDKQLIYNSVQYSALNTFHLFSHGKPGNLLIEGTWMGASQIANFFQKNKYLENKEQLFIYGCNFAKGKEGAEAVKQLELALGINISASTNITGKGGDWNLEVGDRAVAAIAVENYSTSLQISTSITSTDVTNIRQQSPNSGYGSSSKAELSRYVNLKVYPVIRFNIASIPTGSTVTSATITLTRSGSAGTDNRFDFTARRITTGWSESTATWNSLINNIDNSTNYGLANGGRPDPEGTTYSLDVTSLVNAWVNGTVTNNGVAIVPTFFGSSTFDWFDLFSDDDGSTSQRPTLNVTYSTSGTPPPTPPTSATITRTIASDSDDAEEAIDGDMDLSSSDIELSKFL